MMKKLTSFLLAGALMLACLTGCSESANTGTGAGTTTGTGTMGNGMGTGTTGTNTSTDYYGNNGFGTSYDYNNGYGANIGMGPEQNTSGLDSTYADSDYQHSGVTGASRLTADM